MPLLGWITSALNYYGMTLKLKVIKTLITHVVNKMNKIAKAKKAKEELDQIKYLLKTAQISFDEARARAETPLKELNEGMAEVAKQHGFKHRQVGFTGFFR